MHCNGPLDQEHDCPPGEAVTEYAVIDAPPSELGALHDTTDDTFATDPDTPVGTPGVVRGVTESADVALGPSPTALRAVTENVYAVPSTRPFTVHEVVGVAGGAEFVEHVPPPGIAVTV